MKENGFVRVGALVNKLSLGNVIENAKEISRQIKKAYEAGVEIIVTPELSLTGYTCGDMFLQDKLVKDSIIGLEYVLSETKSLNIISIIGMPISTNNALFNCGVVINRGKLLGIIPKTYIPNYKEFYECRWFSSSLNLDINEIELLGQKVPLGCDLLFQDRKNPNITFAIEICEDLWAVTPPSNDYAKSGATIIFNLSSSNELIGKHNYRKNLISSQSSKTISAYIYASSGMLESTSDILFGGASLIYENGTLLKEGERFLTESNIIYQDIDVLRLVNDRRVNKSFNFSSDNKIYRRINIDIHNNISKLERKYSKYPFVPKDDILRNERCLEIINIQSSALARRLIQLNYPKCVIGMSGGLDSTLAFLVTVRAFEKLNLDNKNIIGITMPGFGTTDRTYNNSIKLVESYNATLKEINIKEACTIHMKDIGLNPTDRSITYENIQARERTQILMDVANMEKGIVIGTGDLSELALGWCTYNGDHMSMYSVNSSIPKTLIRYLVNWFMDNEKGIRHDVLKDILSTPISPELLPPDKYGNIVQKTENSIGPYVLHDFFLYHFLRYGVRPKKLYFLALHTFDDFSREDILNYLKVFIKRFFTQQFKRNCVPDGIKVGSISLSPRGDLRMPSDMEYKSYLKELDELEKN
ncbi:nAD+ synthetase [Clostridium sp. CAG:417]|nr:nAD+ synthetase [Clostridium sp. CAG:417]